ncbi:hypothetical protein Avbf_09022 [Armadillidium vulgare]|nr:hypothetical protein Avbf_09022 [Armadillidium vulgare]
MSTLYYVYSFINFSLYFFRLNFNIYFACKKEREKKMDDKSPLSSFVFSIFKPFIFSYRKENFIPPENDNQNDDFTVPSEPSEPSPRDSLLKPDPNKKLFTNPYGQNEGHKNTFIWDFGSHPNEDFGMDRNEDFFEDFSPNFHDGGFESIFRMMDEMFESNPHGHNFPNFPHMPSILPGPHKGDEKKDKTSMNLEIASLLKDPPSYENKAESHTFKESPSLAPPSASTSRFKSTSIVRIRRPDGVIEETRKYRDSDGREETEIITREPSPEDNIQPVEPFTDPSFSGIFKRFPFSIF